MQKATKLGCLVACLFLLPALLHAQGVSTAAMNGTVMDNKGQPLPAANVVAVHNPSGSISGAATRVDGRFNIPGVRVGGPYTVTASLIGYKAQKQENVYLTLGQDLKIAFVLAEEAVELGETVTVAERYEILSASRTGAATNIDAVEIKQLPTLNRSVSDFARLTPQAGTNLNSFAGRNNLYNNLTIDGSVFNNVFGLASEVGGQTNSQPVSLDAVEEIRVSIAPYDVRQGDFTGANISVVTKSGNNRIQGSAYSYFRNEDLISSKLAGVSINNPDFSKRILGLSLSGPLLKDRAFLFANAEFDRRGDPGSSFRAKTTASETGADVANVLSSDLDRLRSFVNSKFSFDPGDYQGYDLDTRSDKVAVRFDYNINQSNRLMLRYNYLKSNRNVPLSNSGASGGRQPSSARLPFANSNYFINNNFNSFIGQLTSTLGSKYSNEFTVGFTALRDFRSSDSPIFPLVDIENGAGSTITTFGYEPFTPNNLLDSDIFQISDNFSAYFGKHTFTIGTAHELYSFKNGFTPDFYSRYRFRTIDEFINHVNGTPVNGVIPQPTVFSIQYSAVRGVEVPFAEIGALQASLYAQDEFQASPKLKLTLGLRMDVPIFTKDLPANPVVSALTFANGEKIDVSKLPNATPLWSPRLGFNFDPRGDRSVQVRGGIGVFTGKIPFVWVSNQASNNGVLFGATSVTGNGTTVLRDPATGKNITFTPDYKTYVPTNVTLPATILVNATAEDFKFPQVWRNNLAVDAQLPFGLIGTLEGIYSKDLNAVFHRNANFDAKVGNFAGADNRPRYANTDAGIRINDNITNAIILDNTSEGFQYTLTAELRKQFSRGSASLAYTNGKSRDLTSSVSAIAATSWSTNQIVTSPNDPVLAFASNHQTHRLVGTASYRLNYLGLAGTTVSAIYVGGPVTNNLGFLTPNYTYTYAGDMNGDRISGNDLMYIPRDASEISLEPNGTTDTRTAAQIWEQLDAYIKQDPYLSKHRGEYAERSGAQAPWTGRLDLALKHEFFKNVGGQRNGLEVSFELVNFGNLIKSDWGVIQTPITTSPVSYRRYDATANRPVFTMPLVNGQPLTKTFQNDPTLNSRWQAQFSFRYSFN